MAFNILSLSLIVTTVIILFLAAWTWRFRNTPGAKPFALLLLCCAIYSLGYAMEIFSANLETIMFWLRVQYLGIPFIPALLIVFALTYTGRNKNVPFPVWIVIFAVSLAVMLMFNTNEMHGLHFQNVHLSTKVEKPLRSFSEGVLSPKVIFRYRFFLQDHLLSRQ